MKMSCQGRGTWRSEFSGSAFCKWRCWLWGQLFFMLVLFSPIQVLPAQLLPTVTHPFALAVREKPVTITKSQTTKKKPKWDVCRFHKRLCCVAVPTKKHKVSRSRKAQLEGESTATLDIEAAELVLAAQLLCRTGDGICSSFSSWHIRSFFVVRLRLREPLKGSSTLRQTRKPLVFL